MAHAGHDAQKHYSRLWMLGLRNRSGDLADNAPEVHNSIIATVDHRIHGECFFYLRRKSLVCHGSSADLTASWTSPNAFLYWPWIVEAVAGGPKTFLQACRQYCWLLCASHRTSWRQISWTGGDWWTLLLVLETSLFSNRGRLFWLRRSPRSSPSLRRRFTRSTVD